MAVYCFECGVEVPDTRKIVSNGRAFCSEAHTRGTRKDPAPPQIKQATQPAAVPKVTILAPEPRTPAPATQAGPGSWPVAGTTAPKKPQGA
jgi:hypothetical protein